MADLEQRTEVCKRHGISERLAAELHGATPAEWEADAAARASIARMFGGGQPQPDEQPEAEVPPTEEAKPLDAAELAAETRRASDKAFLEALLAPKRKHVELIRSLHPLPEEES